MVNVKKIALQGIILITLASVSLWVVSQQGPSNDGKVLLKNLSAKDINQQVFDCKLANSEDKSTNTKFTVQDFAAKERCLAEVAVASFRDGKLALFNDSLTQVAGKNLSGFMYCHTAMHKAGSMLFKDVVDFSDFFKGGVNKEGICDNGLIHGYFDALGVDESFTFNSWQEISNKCSEFKDNQDVAKLIKTVCGDGAGHAIWQGTRNYDISFSGCLSLNDTLLRQSCIAGVLMQIPKDDADAYLQSAIDKGIKFCQGFKRVDDQKGCERELAVQGRFAVGFDKDLQAKYCSFFPTKKLQQTCLQFDSWCGTQRSEECNRV